MDPCQFVRVMVGNLALKIPVASRPARSGVHPSSTPCYCKIRLNKLPYQTTTLPLIPPENTFPPANQPLTLSASFDLSKSDLEKISSKSIFKGSKGSTQQCVLTVEIYTGRRGTTCGLSSGRLLGKVTVSIDLKGVEGRPCVFHNGWVEVGKGGKGLGQVHLTVASEADPRFVFEFDGEPECSPQVFQVEGGRRQPVFSCKFSCRSSGDRNNNRSLSMQSEPSSSRSWFGSFGSDRDRVIKERKGWSVTVHDLSGSPVALASMVTPFVASPGYDRVSRSNPGAWLILRPGDGTWKPWGRLEAWRERGGSSEGLGYRFELLPDTNMGGSGVLLSESTLSTNKGGKFRIDLTGNIGKGCGDGHGIRRSRSRSPGCSPHGSGDFGYGFWPLSSYRGFVMSSTVEGEGKCSKPAVEIGVQNVGCSEDAAAFVALSAAIDLSMDACKLFSHKMRNEFIQHQEKLV